MKERSNMIGKYIMTLLVLLMTAATAGAVTYLDDKTETCDSGPDYQNESNGISGNRSISASRQRITLKKDGYWNTLCLPFLVTAEEVATTLAPTALKTLESSTFSGGTLTLNFEDATEIEAGKPYIIRWENTEGTKGARGIEIGSPTVTGIIQNESAAIVETDYVDFIGIYSPVTLTAGDRTVLYLGAENKLYWPNAEVKVNSFCAYFQLKNGLEVGEPTGQNAVRAFSLSFGDEQTGIVSISKESRSEGAAAPWFTLDGRRIARPTAPGLYLHGGKKVVVH